MKPTREERANMSKDEMLRALWLLDDYTDSFGWHTVTQDGLPEPNKYGFWCKRTDGRYDRLWYEEGFFYYNGSMKIYVKENTVIAWQRLTGLAI